MNLVIKNKLFEDYFSSQYKERWPSLLEAMLTDERQVLRKNLFSEVVHPSKLTQCEFLENCYWRNQKESLIKNQNGYFEYYIMDPASIFVAMALNAQPNEAILDMCAAPGGKSLIIAEQMHEGELILNEYSESRRARLVSVLKDYIPQNKRLFIHVKGLDGNQYGLRQPEYFDRVLADVPCSGERHLLQNSSEFANWTLKRTKNLAVRQYSLLSSAWLGVKLGGRIVYSTCSISEVENDQVVAKLIKKRKVQVVRESWLEKYDFIEKTENGYAILPDRCGFGPMYFSILVKV